MPHDSSINAVQTGVARENDAGTMAGKLPDVRPLDSPPHERLPRRWLIGLTAMVAIGATGIGAQLFLLSKAVNLEAGKAAWQATLDQRLKEQDGMDAGITKARAALAKVRADIETADHELADKQTALAEQQAAKREAVAARQLADSATAERERALAAKAEAERQLADLQAKMAAANGDKDQLDKRRTNLMTEIASAQSQLKDVKSDLAERAKSEALVESLKRDVSQLSARRDALQTEVTGAEKLRAELKTAEREVAALRGEKSALDLRIVELKKDQQILETQKKISDDAASVAQKTEQELVIKAAAARKRCNELEQEGTAAEAKLRDQSKALAGVEGELKTKQVFVDQLKDVEVKLEQRKSELKTLEDNLAKARAAATRPGNADSKPASVEGGRQ